jgi:hypothetical protein
MKRGLRDEVCPCIIDITTLRNDDSGYTYTTWYVVKHRDNFAFTYEIATTISP